MSFGTKLRNKRNELGLTMEQVAYMAGITKAEISLYERELRTPRLDSAVNLCKVLGIEMVIGGEHEQ